MIITQITPTICILPQNRTLNFFIKILVLWPKITYRVSSYTDCTIFYRCLSIRRATLRTISCYSAMHHSGRRNSECQASVDMVTYKINRRNSTCTTTKDSYRKKISHMDHSSKPKTFKMRRKLKTNDNVAVFWTIIFSQLP